MKLSIPDMSCGHCKATVEKTIASIDPTAQVTVDLATRTVEVRSTAPDGTVLKALDAEGYPATLAG